MRTNTRKKSRVNVVTLGCSKNIYDSEVLMGQLTASGVATAHDSKARRGDTVIINTCGFIDTAKQESIDTILEYAEARQQGKIDRLIVMGCLVERYQKELSLEIEGVDAWHGTRHLPQVLADAGADYKHELLGERQLSTPGHYAFFKISEGCDRPCSFCAIPLMRGKHVSTPIEELMKRAERLAAQGTRELVLIAQESTYYGQDIYGKRRLADLLNALSAVDGIEWLRLQYAYPAGFPLDVLDAIATNPKVCNYIDIPLQHISDNILRLMRRGTNREKTYRLLGQIRERVPGIAVRTTLLTGHPGETEEDFEQLMQFVQDVKFDRLGVFPYSHEENTHSHTMQDDVPEEVKQERVERLMEAQRDISLEINAAKVGSVLKVMIDRVEGEYYIGRTEHDSPEVDNEVLVPVQSGYLRTGDFAQIKITDALEYDLYGTHLH